MAVGNIVSGTPKNTNRIGKLIARQLESHRERADLIAKIPTRN